MYTLLEDVALFAFHNVLVALLQRDSTYIHIHACFTLRKGPGEFPIPNSGSLIYVGGRYVHISPVLGCEYVLRITSTTQPEACMLVLGDFLRLGTQGPTYVSNT